MNILVGLLALYTPDPLKRMVLDRLCVVAADAFGVPRPVIRGMPFGEMQQEFARLTCSEAGRTLGSGADLESVRCSLREGTQRLGEMLRRRLLIRSRETAFEAVRILYRQLGIDLTISPAGDLTVSRCSFAGRFSPEVCRLISSMDEGLIAGLTGGGRLAFTERLTEGKPACSGSVQFLEGTDEDCHRCR